MIIGPSSTLVPQNYLILPSFCISNLLNCVQGMEVKRIDLISSCIRVPTESVPNLLRFSTTDNDALR